MTKDEFLFECEKIGISISKDKQVELEKYLELLLEWNNKFNLTSITEKKDVYLKHFYDSLCLNKAVDLNKSINICDFGTGAGFPGLVLAIIYNNVSVTLVESNNKKVMFLNEVKKVLNIVNVNIVNDRIENYAIKNREKFDVVTCRAVSNLGIVCELSISLLKLNGLFTPLKSNISEEVKKYTHDFDKLGYKLKNVVKYTLPFEESNREIPIFIKYKNTDKKYPRNYATILKEHK